MEFQNKHPFMTIAQVADALQVSKVTVRNMVKRGDFVGVTFPGSNMCRIRTEEFQAFLEGMLGTAANVPAAPQEAVTAPTVTAPSVTSSNGITAAQAVVAAHSEVQTYLTLQEVALYLKTSENSVNSLINRGLLPCSQIIGMPKGKRVRVADLVAFQKQMDAQAVEPKAKPVQAASDDAETEQADNVTAFEKAQKPKKRTRRRDADFFFNLGASK